MKFKAGDMVYIDDPSCAWHGQVRTVEEVGDWEYPYRLGDGFYYPESELSATSPLVASQPETAEVQGEWATGDVDSGLGIGGINRDQSAPAVPSVEAVSRVQRMHDTDTVCSICGASQNFDGAMFTTIAGGNICDDCV